MLKSQEFQEKQIAINGIQINYKIASLPVGNAKPVVLILHGWGRGSDSYVHIMKMLAGVGYNVVIPDLPGFGKSSPPPAAWGVYEYANFIFQFAHALNLQNFALAGHSFGGQTAAHFAVLYPQTLTKLILVAAAAIRRKPSFKKRVIWLIAKTTNFFLKVWPLSMVRAILQKAFYRLLGSSDYLYSQGIMKDVRAKLLSQDLSAELSKIKVPTLIVWGDQDKSTPVRDAYALQAYIPNSILSVIPGTGHLLYKEAPEKFVEIIKQFLKHSQ